MKTTKHVFALICTLIFISTNVSAQSESVQALVKSTNEARNKVLVEVTQVIPFKVGELVSINENCTTEIVQINANAIVLNAELCDDKSDFKKSAKIKLSSLSKEKSDSNLKSASPSGQSLSQGVRISLVKAFLDGELNLSRGYSTYSGSGSVEHDFGVGVGYAQINEQSVGFIGQAVFTQYNNKSNSIRLDGNVTYGLNQYVYLLGGLNIHKFTKGAQDLNAGLGLQFGFGAQLNQNVGLGLTYVMINNNATIDGIKADFTAKGLEINLNITF